MNILYLQHYKEAAAAAAENRTIATQSTPVSSTAALASESAFEEPRG